MSSRGCVNVHARHVVVFASTVCVHFRCVGIEYFCDAVKLVMRNQVGIGFI